MLQVLVLVLGISSFASAEEWGYEGSSCDPECWTHHYETCEGEHQSPIDIDTGSIITIDGERPELNGEANTGTFFNNGHTVQLNFNGEYTISNIGEGYNVAQLHFHWGSTDSTGSEHTIDGNQYPMEMHVVSYSSEYGSLSEAVASGEHDALAVLGFMFQVDGSDNGQLHPMTEKLSQISQPGSSTTLSGFKLHKLVEDVIDNSPLARYQGGLTTPGCYEIVTWTVYLDPIPVSASQLQKFRNTGIVDNFRPTQDLHGRVVLNFD